MADGELWTQVRVFFVDTLVEVAHLRPGQSFTLGEGPEADLTYATPGLHRLVMATPTGAVLEHLGSKELVALGPGESARVELGTLYIEIGCEPRVAPELGRRPVELGWWLSLASSTLVIVLLLALALMAAEAALPPIESDTAPYMAYTARSGPVAEDPRRDPLPELQRAPRQREPERERRAPPKPSDPSTPASQADADDWPSPAEILHIAQSRPGPRSVTPMLRRDSSPVEAARKGGMLGVMPDDEEIEAFASVSAASFGPDVDDSALWAAMTDGPPDTTIGGLELTGIGRGGGEASEIVRSGAPPRPRLDAPVLGECLGDACNEQLRARVVETRVAGELDSKRALRFANSLRDEWVACLGPGEAPAEFEFRYTVLPDGSIGGAKVPRTQLSPKSRRCIVAAIERGAGPGPSADGRSAKVMQRVEIGRRRGARR